MASVWSLWLTFLHMLLFNEYGLVTSQCSSTVDGTVTCSTTPFQSVTGTDAEAFWKFVVPPGANILVDINICGSAIDTILEIYDATCTNALYSCDNWGVGSEWRQTTECSWEDCLPNKNEYGTYDLSPGTYYIGILGYLAETGTYQFSISCTTSSPTPQPTTKAPTTKAPTTKAPTTKAPTTAIPTTPGPTTATPTTAAPTTSQPTAQPTTAQPSNIPTTDPTNDPTTDPTFDPTTDPTTDPTNDPTADPTADPTVEPTLYPTWNPTVEPTNDPTKNPTYHPTSDPTGEQLRFPTRAPIQGSETTTIIYESSSTEAIITENRYNGNDEQNNALDDLLDGNLIWGIIAFSILVLLCCIGLTFCVWKRKKLEKQLNRLESRSTVTSSPKLVDSVVNPSIEPIDDDNDIMNDGEMMTADFDRINSHSPKSHAISYNTSGNEPSSNPNTSSNDSKCILSNNNDDQTPHFPVVTDDGMITPQFPLPPPPQQHEIEIPNLPIVDDHYDDDDEHEEEYNDHDDEDDEFDDIYGSKNDNNVTQGNDNVTQGGDIETPQ